jgi:hypothetical protein
VTQPHVLLVSSCLWVQVGRCGHRTAFGSAILGRLAPLAGDRLHEGESIWCVVCLACVQTRLGGSDFSSGTFAAGVCGKRCIVGLIVWGTSRGKVSDRSFGHGPNICTRRRDLLCVCSTRRRSNSTNTGSFRIPWFLSGSLYRQGLLGSLI